jgi:hypothetical protein
MSEDIVRMNEDVDHFSGHDASDKELFDAQMISNLKDRVNRLELHLSRCLLDIEHSDKWYEREEAYEKRYAEALELVRGGR